MTQRLRIAPVALTASLVSAIGCSLLVSGEVPDFTCEDTPSACPPDFRCDPLTRRCVILADAGELDADVPDQRGPAAQTDSGDSGLSSGPRGLGAKCRIDAECTSLLCASSTVLTTAITQTTGPICTQTCCTSADCPNSFVCFNGGTGGGYCVPANLAKRTPSTAGGKHGGVPCTADNECRSGLCTGAPKACVDTCCVSSDCDPSSVCRIVALAAPEPSHDVWVCGRPTGKKAIGTACEAQSECETELCIPSAGGSCRPSCSSTASCRSLGGAFASGRCVYVTSDVDVLKFCETASFPDRSAAGEPCGDNSVCQSGFCDAELKKCANVCATDKDCASTESCRPSAVKTPYLRCVGKSVPR